MSRGATVGQALALGVVVLRLTACAPASEPASSSVAAADPRLASSGVCDAIGALPADRTGAIRAFQNEAHAALHSLAAAGGLDRAMAASVLETMGRVEYDISSGAPVDALAPDFGALLDAANAALNDLHIDPPACPSQ